MTSAQKKDEAVSIAVEEDRVNNTHILDTNPHDVNIYTQQENISSVSLQSRDPDSEKGETQTQIQQDYSGFITVSVSLKITFDPLSEINVKLGIVRLGFSDFFWLDEPL